MKVVITKPFKSTIKHSGPNRRFTPVGEFDPCSKIMVYNLVINDIGEKWYTTDGGYIKTSDVIKLPGGNVGNGDFV